jgi:hypothetical protein
MSDLWARFDERFSLPPLPDAGAPLFVLSAGWRSGSTLLQRLLCSTGEVLVWGEPYGRAGLIPSLTRSALVLRDQWPGEGQLAPATLPGDLSDRWIANLYPEAAAFRQGFRAMLDAWLREPAASRGYRRFGLKEVRLHAMDAHFLRWIYPDARFFFLVRNPWDAWMSARGGVWFSRWPNEGVQDARGYATHWLRLMESFIAWPDATGMLVRYEDLSQPGFDLGQLSEHGQLRPLNAAVLRKKVRGLQAEPTPLTPPEVQIISQIAGPLAVQLGYDGPGGLKRAA